MKNKAKVYIDGANIFYTQKKLGWVFDWKKIKKLVEKDKEIIEWKYYVGIKEDDEKIKKYLKYLDYTGFNVITKPLKKIRIKKDEVDSKIYKTDYIFKANFDVEITVDILLDKTKSDEVLIFSGDSDFQYLIKKLKSIGKKVIIYSSKETISWELKLEANEVIYFENLKNKIIRK